MSDKPKSVGYGYVAPSPKGRKPSTKPVAQKPRK